MDGFSNSWGLLAQHPIVGLLVVAAVTFGVLTLLSGGQAASALGGMVRVALGFFTAPFVFLRDALTAMRTNSEEEADYRGSRVFMLFRLNRLQYLGLLIVCVLSLSSGITTSLVGLYPQAELAAARSLDEAIQRVDADLATANAAGADAQAQGGAQQLQARVEEARAAYETQRQNVAAFMTANQFSGGAVADIANAGNVERIEYVRSNIDAYMSGCPRGYNWSGMTAESCTQFRTFALALAERRIRELQLAEQVGEAERAFNDADMNARTLAERVASLQAQRDQLAQQRSAVSPFNPKLIGERLGDAVAGLVATLLSVILLVWFGAGLISFFNWLILMMRAAELQNAGVLKGARSEGSSFEGAN